MLYIGVLMNGRADIGGCVSGDALISHFTHELSQNEMKKSCVTLTSASNFED
jgi:hypothetical protein